MEIRNDNIFYDLTTSFRFDGHGKNHLTEMLNEIREEYKIKDQDMRDELQRKCKHFLHLRLSKLSFFFQKTYTNTINILKKVLNKI